MNVLGIETSCDETAASIVADGCAVRSNVIFSQTELHRPHGGVVPEIAARSHVDHLPAVIEGAILKADLGWKGIDAVAATYGPGLASSLLVGLTSGKALAFRLGVEFIAINHLEAHLYAPFLSAGPTGFAAACPFLALIVSGGHTSLVRVDAPGKYCLLGKTLDDAAGETFDKGAKLLGLGYPGGPEIERLARSGNAKAIRFPQGRISSAKCHNNLRGELCFSFSGLKTALMYYLKNRQRDESARFSTADVAASYQEAIVGVLCKRLLKAAELNRVHCAVLGGGVSINSRLRSRLAALCALSGIKLILAEPQYCLDNAAMVAGLAGMGRGIRGARAWPLDVCPNLEIGACGAPA